MKTSSHKEKAASTVKKLIQLQDKLVERIRKTDFATIEAKKIGIEIQKIKNSK
jgi:hypothetical protein